MARALWAVGMVVSLALLYPVIRELYSVRVGGQRFARPYFVCFCLNASMLACGLAEAFARRRPPLAWRDRGAAARLAVPMLLDVAAASCENLGLEYIAASLSSMLVGSSVLFTAFFGRAVPRVRPGNPLPVILHAGDL